jgi:hypothetical protein
MGRRRDREAEEKFGPLPYEGLGAGVQKFRRLARVRPLTREERQAYGAAVEEAVRASQRRALMGSYTPPAPTTLIGGPPITRLLKYEEPLPMIGDPDWRGQVKKNGGDPWSHRAEAVYAAMMEQKR